MEAPSCKGESLALLLVPSVWMRFFTSKLIVAIVQILSYSLLVRMEISFICDSLIIILAVLFLWTHLTSFIDMFGIFNPTIVYDHLGEIYSTLIFGSCIFCIFLYIKGHVAPSPLVRFCVTCWCHAFRGSGCNQPFFEVAVFLFLNQESIENSYKILLEITNPAGMELYPRIGKYFDIKVFTNCRFGMMSWAVLALTYSTKQNEYHPL